MKWLALAVMLGSVSPAWAADGAVLGGVTAPEMAAALTDAKLAAVIEPGQAGPQIWSRLDQHPFNVFFFGCSAERTPRCREAQFYAGFPIEGIFPSALINSWNGSHRFGRAYIDADGNAALELDLDAVGTSAAQIRDTLVWWQTLVPQFAAFLDQSMKQHPKPSASRTPPTPQSAH